MDNNATFPDIIIDFMTLTCFKIFHLTKFSHKTSWHYFQCFLWNLLYCVWNKNVKKINKLNLRAKHKKYNLSSRIAAMWEIPSCNRKPDVLWVKNEVWGYTTWYQLFLLRSRYCTTQIFCKKFAKRKKKNSEYDVKI